MKDTKCPIHSDPIQMYCKTCGTNVCIGCIASDAHKGHEFERIKTIADDKREQLRLYLQESLPRHVQEATEWKSKISKLKQDNDRSRKEVQNQIETKKSSLVKQVETESKHLMLELDTRWEKNNMILETAMATAEMNLKYFQDLQTFCKEGLELKSDLEVIDKYCDLEAMELDREVAVPEVALHGFRESHSILLDTFDIFGSVCSDVEASISLQVAVSENTEKLFKDKSADEHSKNSNADHKTSMIAQFTFEQTSGLLFQDTHKVIQAIVPAGKDHLWISCQGSRKISLVDHNGKIMRTINTNSHVYDAIGSKNGIFLLCKQDVKLLNVTTAKCEVFLNPNPLYPTAVCAGEDGEILICLVDNFASNTDGTSERLTNIYNNQALLLKSIRKAGDKYFGIPSLITYDFYNRRISIYDKQFGRILNFNKQGRHVFYTYTTKSAAAIRFDCNA